MGGNIMALWVFFSITWRQYLIFQFAILNQIGGLCSEYVSDTIVHSRHRSIRCGLERLVGVSLDGSPKSQHTPAASMHQNIRIKITQHEPPNHPGVF